MLIDDSKFSLGKSAHIPVTACVLSVPTLAVERWAWALLPWKWEWEWMWGCWRRRLQQLEGAECGQSEGRRTAPVMGGGDDGDDDENGGDDGDDDENGGDDGGGGERKSVHQAMLE